MNKEKETRKASTLEKVLLIAGILTPVVLAIFVIVEMVSGASISEAIAEYQLFTVGAWLPLILYFLLRYSSEGKKKEMRK